MAAILPAFASVLFAKVDSDSSDGEATGYKGLEDSIKIARSGFYVFLVCLGQGVWIRR